MAGMKSMGQGLLPPWVTWLWLLALTAVLVLHCGHLIRAGGQHRWFHASHILMLVSMLYMYASMEFRWKWFASSSWVVVFWLSTLAIAAWMVLRFVQRRPVSLLWVLALIMQAAMIYMWMPSWAPVLTWALVVYYGLETAAWLGGLLDDTRRPLAVGPGEHAVTQPILTETATSASTVAVMPTRTATRRSQRAEVVSLAQPSALARVSMAVMASSMAYMFAAMQLMR
jgi:hypothetical protein